MRLRTSEEKRNDDAERGVSAGPAMAGAGEGLPTVNEDPAPLFDAAQANLRDEPYQLSVDDLPVAPLVGYAELQRHTTVTAVDPRARAPSQPAAVVLPSGEVALLHPVGEDGAEPQLERVVPAGPDGVRLRRRDGSVVTDAELQEARQVAAATLAEMAAAGQLPPEAMGPPPPTTWRGKLKVWWRRNKRDVITVSLTIGMVVVVAGLAVFAPFGALAVAAGVGLLAVAGEGIYQAWRARRQQRRLERMRADVLDDGNAHADAAAAAARDERVTTVTTVHHTDQAATGDAYGGDMLLYTPAPWAPQGHAYVAQ